MNIAIKFTSFAVRRSILLIPLVAFVLLVSLATDSIAGITDSPLPTLNDVKTKHVYSFTGVTSGINNLETVFFCTSTEKTREFRAAVELFDKSRVSTTPPGSPLNNADADDEPFAPGETRVWQTGTQATFLAGETLQHTGPIDHGSARVVSPSTKLICGAVVVNVVGSGSGIVLPVVKKAKQQGD